MISLLCQESWEIERKLYASDILIELIEWIGHLSVLRKSEASVIQG